MKEEKGFWETVSEAKELNGAFKPLIKDEKQLQENLVEMIFYAYTHARSGGDEGLSFDYYNGMNDAISSLYISLYGGQALTELMVEIEKRIEKG